MSAVPPKGWRRDRLKDVARLRTEKTGEKSEFEDYLELEDIESWTMRILGKRNTLLVESDVTLFKSGDVLFGKLRPYLAKVVQPDFDGKCTGEILAIEPQHIDGGYLKYALIDPEMVYKCTLFSYGAKMPRINWAKQLSTFEITFPPLPEQRRIAGYLDDKCVAIDKAVAAKRKQLEALDKAWSSVLYETVTRGSINEKGVSQSSLPAEWRVRKLGEIGRCQNGISKDGQYFGYGAPFVSYKDVYDDSKLPDTPMGLVDSSEEEQYRYSVRRGDIFFTRTSETADEVGFSSVCLKTIPKATFAGFVIRVRPAIEILLPEYSRYYFRSSSVCQFFAKEMMVVTRASLSQHILKSIPVLIPPLTEQRRIVAYLDERRTAIDSLKANLRRQIDVLEQYRKSLIHECVTGERRLG